MKVGLVCSGGGAKGAFEAGVVKGMMRKVDEFTFSFGCSTGSLVSAAVATEQYDLLTRIYTKVQTGNILLPNIWKDAMKLIPFDIDSPDFSEEALLAWAIATGKDSLYSIEPLMELLDEYMDWKALKKSPIQSGFLTTRWEDNRPMFFSNTDPRNTPEMLRAALKASVSIPVFMPPVKIPNKKGIFYDGGVTKHLPGKEALGAQRLAETDVVIFISTAPTRYQKATVEKGIINTLTRSIFSLSDSNDRNSWEREILETRPILKSKGKKLILVQPEDFLPIKTSLRFVPAQMKAAYNLGIECAKKVVNPQL